MLKFIIGLVVGAALLALAEYLFVAHGGIAMGTDAHALPMEKMLAHAALSSSMGQASREQSPLPADEQNLLAGAHVFQERGCVGCHGRIGDPQSGVGKRMYPAAPHLLPPSKGVTDDQVGETHWVIKNGIRFSGMPSFSGKLSDDELWQVSLLLHNADKLPGPVQDALRQQRPAH